MTEVKKSDHVTIPGTLIGSQRSPVDDSLSFSYGVATPVPAVLTFVLL